MTFDRIDGRIDGNTIDWEEGNCYGSVSSSSDPDPHFPDKHEHADEARENCSDCPILMECRRYAIEHGIEHGVWGGLTSSQLRKRAKEQDFPTPCVLCRELFDPYSSNDKYCSTKCADKASNRRAMSRRHGSLPTHIIDRRTA